LINHPIADHLARITYLPGSYIQIDEDEKGIVLHLYVLSPDSRDFDKPITRIWETWMSRRVPEKASFSNVLWAVKSLINNASAHELDEWLRVDGKQVSSPHEQEVT